MNTSKKIRWHRLFAEMLKELLAPLNITVIPDAPIMTDSPKADVLLIRRETPQWTDMQLMSLPDGIRDSQADHILIEFKFTESVNQKVLNQALAYDTFFKRTQSLKDKQIQTVILSSKTPAEATLKKFGYTKAVKPGVYHSNAIMLEDLHIIVINDLSDADYNDFVKCFASRKNIRWNAFKRIMHPNRQKLSNALFYIINSIVKLMNRKNQEVLIMNNEITSKQIVEVGKNMYYNIILNEDGPDYFLEKFGIEQILSKLKPEERLSGLKPEERLSGLKPEERLSGLTSKEIEQYLKTIN